MILAIQSITAGMVLIILFSVIFIGIGVGMLIKLLIDLRKATLSKNWLTTDGTIISSELDVETSSDADGDQSTTFIAKITYTYVIDGAEYKSECVNFNYGMRTSNRRKQQAVVDMYFPGKKVVVYYDPQKHEQAVLERRVNGAFTTFLIAAIFILIGIVVLVSTLN
jgi:hypothetical protein